MTCTADDVAAAIIDRVGPVDPKKLQKLAYYAQAWHLAIAGEPLFDDEIEAWRDGPVTCTLYRKHRKEWRPMASWPGDPKCVPEASRGLLDLVCTAYGALDGAALSILTHSEEPWQNARQGMADDAASSEVISKESMARFYRHRTLGGRAASDLAIGGAGVIHVPEGDLDVLVKETISELPVTPRLHPATGRDYGKGLLRDRRVIGASRGRVRPAR